MKNQLSLLRWMGLCTLVLAVFTGFAYSAESAVKTAGAKATERVDLIIIDSMAAEGALELPPVMFMHDQHTQAMAKENKDCSSCHLPANDGLEGQIRFSYVDTADLKGAAKKDAFHKNCIGCHAAFAAKGSTTGPLESSCRGCHVSTPKVAQAQTETNFFKLYHQTHIDSAGVTAPDGSDKNCGACHHTGYDATQKTFIVKDGTENACSSCHMSATEKKELLASNPDASDAFGEIAVRADIKKAAHTSCISCHNAQGISAINCADCHSRPQNSTVGKSSVAETPAERLNRNQPDTVLLIPDSANQPPTTPPVIFNHKTHEAFVGDCKSCHHKGISSCSSCHSVDGKKEGNFITMYAAMHKVDSTRSCIGCHNQVVQEPSCAGCHASMPKETKTTSCAKCHTLPEGMTTATLRYLSPNDQAAVVQEVKAREIKGAGTFDQTEIPDLVTIGALSDKYEPSVMPHRKIVKALADKESKSPLAKAFHTDETSLCQGCHHNSPASSTPPKCVSCHAPENKAATVSGPPGLKAAYHLRCMSCHTRMEQKPAATDCNACHKPRVK